MSTWRPAIRRRGRAITPRWCRWWRRPSPSHPGGWWWKAAAATASPGGVGTFASRAAVIGGQCGAGGGAGRCALARARPRLRGAGGRRPEDLELADGAVHVKGSAADGGDARRARTRGRSHRHARRGHRAWPARGRLLPLARTAPSPQACTAWVAVVDSATGNGRDREVRRGPRLRRDDQPPPSSTGRFWAARRRASAAPSTRSSASTTRASRWSPPSWTT